jgi:hypothetical protein
VVEVRTLEVVEVVDLHLLMPMATTEGVLLMALEDRVELELEMEEGVAIMMGILQLNLALRPVAAGAEDLMIIVLLKQVQMDR